MSLSEEILYQIHSACCEDRFGVKLDAFDGIISMSHAHDFMIVERLRCDLERFWKSAPISDERMVASSLERILDSPE